MSMTLITKSGGTVTPSIDGALFAAALPDCILDGCDITASGAVLTISAGHMVIGGRIIHNNASQTYTFSASKKLVAKIENDALTVSQASKSSTQTKDNINNGSGKYEAVLASVTYASGTITIDSTLPKYCRNGGILFGTTENPPAGNYADGTLYIQYS